MAVHVDQRVYDEFWAATEQVRDLFGIDDKTIDLNIMLDRPAIEGFPQVELARVTLIDLFEKAHKILRREPHDHEPTQVCYRELAFWNQVRKEAGFSVEDVSKTPWHAKNAKHAETGWYPDVKIRERGTNRWYEPKPEWM